VKPTIEAIDPGRGWMLALQKGDSRAFDSIVLHYEKPVRHFIGRYLADDARAEDLAQEAFLRVYRARKRYKPTAKFQTWLFTIVTRLCLNELRRQARQRRVFTSPRGRSGLANENDAEDDYLENVADTRLESPHETLERGELAEILRKAIGDLPENQRAALLMVRFNDTRYDEIAEVLGVSDKAVKSILSRARQRLRETLTAYREGKRKVGRMVKGKSEEC
jgi:RNA polymerase sigma-70 factor (ECF subfamily)